MDIVAAPERLPCRSPLLPPRPLAPSLPLVPLRLRDHPAHHPEIHPEIHLEIHLETIPHTIPLRCLPCLARLP